MRRENTAIRFLTSGLHRNAQSSGAEPTAYQLPTQTPVGGWMRPPPLQMLMWTPQESEISSWYSVHPEAHCTPGLKERLHTVSPTVRMEATGGKDTHKHHVFPTHLN